MNGNINDNNFNNSILETKEFKLLFNLLEKAEQILSIINLSDSSISKYNTLKKITYEMLNLEFKPLEKKYINSSDSSEQNDINTNNNINQNSNDETLYLLFFHNIKKTMLIELILEFILNNINNTNQEQNINYYLNNLTDIFNLPSDIISSKTPNDISYEAKLEEAKLAELFTKVDQAFMNTFDNLKHIRMNYENEINQLKENCNRNISDFKNPNKINISNNNEKNNYFLEKMALLIDESYEKYRQNFPNENNPSSIACKDGKFDEDIMKLEFAKKAFDSFFDNNNNKYFNNKMKNNINVPYNINNNNVLINDICSSLPEIQKENDIFHKNFNDLMNYIETNIEGKVI